MSSDWTFNGTWPYEPKWFDSRDGRMHYVDEGAGRPVVMVHGNPTWGYLYRNFIEPVREAGFRALVPDHLGFGRSDKPGNPGLYRIYRHVERFEAWLDMLDVQDATVVVQDWGGPIGLAWATRHPARVRSLFILNTVAHRPREKAKLPFALTLLRMPAVGEVLVKGLHMFVRGFMFQQGINKKDRLTPTVKDAYLSPHPTWSSRTSILVFPREIPEGPQGRVSELMGDVELGLQQHFRDKSVHIAWPMKDPAFTPEMLDSLWLHTFPDAEVTRIEDASHYVQEDAHETVVPKLLEFLQQ